MVHTPNRVSWMVRLAAFTGLVWLSACAPPAGLPAPSEPPPASATSMPPSATPALPTPTAAATAQPSATPTARLTPSLTPTAVDPYDAGRVPISLRDTRLPVFSLDGRRIAVWNKQAVEVWELALDAPPGQGTGTRVFQYALPSPSRDVFITQAALAPDGQTLAVAFWYDASVMGDAPGGFIRMFDLISGQASYRISPAHAHEITMLEFTPDAQTLISGARLDGTWKTWRAQDGRLLRSVRAHSDWLVSLDVSGDGAYVATASLSEDPTVKVFSLAGQLLNVVQKGNFDGAMVEFSSDGQYLLINSQLGWKLLRTAGWQPVDFAFDARGSYTFLPGAHTLAAHHNGHRLYALETGQVSGQWPGGYPFSPDGSLSILRQGSEGLEIRRTGQEPIPPPVIGALRLPTATPYPSDTAPPRTATPRSTATPGATTTTGPTATPAAPAWEIAQTLTTTAVESLTFSPDGRLLAAGLPRERAIQFWQTSDWTPGQRLTGTSVTSSLDFSPDNTRLAASNRNTAPRVFEVGSGAELVSLTGAQNSEFVDFAPDGASLAAGTLEPQLYATEGWQRTASLPAAGEDGFIQDAAYSPKGKFLLAGYTSGQIRLWQVNPPKLISQVKQTGEPFVLSVAFAPDTQTYATNGIDGTVLIWSTSDARVKKRLVAPGAILLAYSPDGRYLALGTNTGAVIVYRVKDWKIWQVLQLQAEAVWGLAFSPDSRELAVGADSGLVVYSVAP